MNNERKSTAQRVLRITLVTSLVLLSALAFFIGCSNKSAVSGPSETGKMRDIVCVAGHTYDADGNILAGVQWNCWINGSTVCKGVSDGNGHYTTGDLSDYWHQTAVITYAKAGYETQSWEYYINYLGTYTHDVYMEEE
jgi:hypothetical protein